MKEAQQAVEETLIEYKQFLEKLSSKQRQEVISTLGLRMEELKAQKAAMEEGLKHDWWNGTKVPDKVSLINASEGREIGNHI